MHKNLSSQLRFRLFDKFPLLVIALFVGLSFVYLTLQAANAASLRQEEQPDVNKLEEVQATDLRIQVEINPQSIRPAGWLTITLHYTNTLAIQVNNVRIQNTLGIGQIFDGQYQSSPIIPSGQYTYTGAPTTGYTLRWDIPTLPAQSSGTIIYNTQVLTTAIPSINQSVIIIGSSATIASLSDAVSGGYGDDSAIVIGPLLSISKTGTPTSLLPGRTITYTLTVKNNDMMDGNPRPDVISATNLIITDTFSIYTSFVSATGGGVYSPTLNAVVWRLAELQPGATAVLQFTVVLTDRVDSGTAIKNLAANYKVISDELLQAIKGGNDVNATVQAVLRKTVVDKNGGQVTVFPSEEVTYTITVYNPLPVPLTGVIVTDTLPLTPDPFIYMRTVPGCNAPTLVDGGRKLVWSINLPGFGSISCSFAVKVPTTIVFSGEATDRTFTNALVATHPDTYFSPESGLAPVKVLAPLIMSKTVTPSHVLPGETVTYTVILNNRGPFLISSIRLTDTLEGDFHFLDMVMGPDPLPAFSYDPIVWNGLSVPAGQQYQLVFTAYANGDWLQTYKNNLIAYSPDADIPNLIGVAGVKIDAPIGFTKTATPTSVFLGQTVEYDVSVFNLSDVTWLMSRFEDRLPAGFLEVGSGEDTVTYFFTPAQPIPGGDSWSGTFQAQVANVNCSDLPKTYSNLVGNINVTFVSPINTTVYNIKALAPVTVNPNILVDLIPQPKTVIRGGVVTYTLHLENISPFPAQNSTVAVTLPPNFSYIETLPGYTQPSSVSGSPVVITWQNLTIWGNSEVSIVFTVQASEADGVRVPSFSATAPGVCFGKLGSGDHPLGNGRVTIVQYVVSMTKIPAINKLPPRSLIDYTITFNNLDAYNTLLDAITDTMPADFTYFSMVLGPQPFLVQGNQVFWKNISLPPGKTTWKLRLQSGTLYGTYTNHIAAHSPTTGLQPVTSTGVQVLPLFDLNKVAGVSTIIPGSIVPYTITLVNLSQVKYLNVYITDTLPAGMTYYRMRPGYPQPIQIGANGDQPVWLLSSINANGASVRIAFEARTNPYMSPGVYYNQVIGSSISGSVPGPISTAPFTILQNFFRILLPFLRH